MPASSRVPFTDREALEKHQLAELQQLVACLLESNPFYQRKLAAAGIQAPPASLTSWSEGRWFTTKEELSLDQQAHPPYGSNLTYPLSAYSRCHQTSGSSGHPMRWLDTPASWSWMLDRWETVYSAAEVTHQDRIFFAFSFGPFLGFWTAFEAAVRLGALCLPGGGLGTAARLRSLIDNQATVLCCTPTYAIHLGESTSTSGFSNKDLHSVRRIIVAGEPGGSIPATREHIRSLWPRAEVMDHHGMTEVGPVTYPCPQRPGHLHVMECAYIAEVIHPETGTPTPAGERGELILTNLGRTGSPLLRYRTGDLVVAGDRQSVCACGTTDLTLVGGIVARQDDMVVVRGVNIYPSAMESILRRVPGIAEYQVSIHQDSGALTRIRLTVEPIMAVSESELRALKQRLAWELEQAFSMRMELVWVAPGTLPRHELKSRRWQRVKEQIL